MFSTSINGDDVIGEAPGKLACLIEYHASISNRILLYSAIDRVDIPGPSSRFKLGKRLAVLDTNLLIVEMKNQIR